MALSASGLGSGLDINSLVSQLMAVERQPLTAMARKEASFQARLSAFGQIKSSLSALQTAANDAVRDGLGLYDHRHGWNGVEQHFDVAADADARTLAAHLRGIPAQNGLMPVVVSRVADDGGAVVVRADGQEITLPAASSKWTGRTPAKLL